MKSQIKKILSRLGLRVLLEPAGIAMGYDLWRDIRLLLGHREPLLCIDVGANHGDVTAEMLRLSSITQVHAFEPSVSCGEILRTRFAAHPRVTLVASGLGDVETTCEFHRYANDHLSSFLPLQSAATNPFQGEPEVARDMVPVTTLDRYATRQGIDTIDLLKIDTQGYDHRVLQGAAGLLHAGKVKHVLVELNFVALYEQQSTPEEIISLLSRHGLQLVDFYEKCRRNQRLAWCTALFGRISQ